MRWALSVAAWVMTLVTTSVEQRSMRCATRAGNCSSAAQSCTQALTRASSRNSLSTIRAACPSSAANISASWLPP